MINLNSKDRLFIDEKCWYGIAVSPLSQNNIGLVFWVLLKVKI